MKKVYTLHRNYSDIIQWLQENVGPLLHYQPIIFWHGDGWHMRNYHKTDLKNRKNNRQGWINWWEADEKYGSNHENKARDKREWQQQVKKDLDDNDSNNSSS